MSGLSEGEDTEDEDLTMTAAYDLFSKQLQADDFELQVLSALAVLTGKASVPNQSAPWTTKTCAPMPPTPCCSS